MNWKTVLVVLLHALVLCASALAAQDRGESPRATESRSAESRPAEPRVDDKTANVRLMVSAEDRPTVPAGSKIQWEGSGDDCRTVVTGEQSLRPTDATPVTLPVCKVKLTIFITGFSTKAVTLDLVGNEKKYADPIHIKVKLQWAPEVSWVHEGP